MLMSFPKATRSAGVIVLGTLSLFLLVLSGKAASAVGLHCEYVDDPMGIDVRQPRLSWTIQSEERGALQTTYRVLVASSLPELKQDHGALWDSGEIRSDQSVNIVYAGKPLESGQRCYWKVRVQDQHGKTSDWSETAGWTMGLLEEKDWRGQWIGAEEGVAMPPRKFFRNGDRQAAVAITQAEAPALYLRREATLPKRPVRATAYVCGLGYFELYLNGQRVGDQVMDPIFTDYAKRVSYVTFDVTSLLREGPNALAVILGNGFFNLPTPDLFQFEKAEWRKPPRLRLDVVMEFEDGSTSRLISDREWKWRTGPIVFNCLRGGETIDSRIDLGAWQQPGFVDTAEWKPVINVTPSAAVLAAAMAPPMRIIETISPVAVTEPKPGVWLADFGKNLTGWARLESLGTAGQVVQLAFNEVLAKDGTLDANFSGGHTYGRFQHGEFILKGGAGPSVYEPRFTYHGFRYVQVTGLGEGMKLNPGAIQAKLVHTDLADAGGFECSNPRLNQLHAAVRRTLLNCVHGMPAEEPTREKMGWTQDGQNTMETYVYNFDSPEIYRKYVQDMLDDQETNGHVPPVIPTQGWGYVTDKGEIYQYDDPWWGGTLAIVVDNLYTYYGDREILERAYEPMRRYVDWLGTTAKDHILSWSLGDWLELQYDKERLTAVPITSTAAYFHLANLLTKHAAILGKADDATKYAQLAVTIRDAFNANYLDQDGWYQRDSQTAQALPLALGLVPAERVAQVRANLLADLERRGRHLTNGFIGLMPTLYELSDHGSLDLAYAAVTQEQGSGWMHMLEDGSDTVGENIHPKGYGTNHHPFGACVGAWFYRNLAGIRPDPAGPGFKKIIIKPGVVGDLTWVKAHYDSVHGRIAAAWQRDGADFTLDVTIPANTTATVFVPARSAEAVLEGAARAIDSPGLEFLRLQEGAAVFAVPAGRYHFVSQRALPVR